VLQISTIKQVECPEIWVAAGNDCSFLEKFDYILTELPSKGMSFCKDDLLYIKVGSSAVLSWYIHNSAVLIGQQSQASVHALSSEYSFSGA
jgi:hypothetical protein